MAELELKMEPDAILTFSISALPPEVTFQMSVHFLHPWTLTFVKNMSLRFVNDSILIEISNEMYKRGLFLASCIASILNRSLTFGLLGAMDCISMMETLVGIVLKSLYK